MARNCCVDIFREEICDETILGIPCFIGEDIIGLAKFSDSGFFDGYCFIEKSDISRVRHGGNEQDAIFALIERKKQLSFMKKDFHFQSMRDVIEQFKTEIITIFIENSSFPVFLNCSRESREVPEFIVPTLIEKNTNFFG